MAIVRKISRSLPQRQPDALLMERLRKLDYKRAAVAIERWKKNEKLKIIPEIFYLAI